MAHDILQLNPESMAKPGGHYSHAVVAGGFVFVSGQLPIKPDGTKLNEAPFEQQTKQVLDNVALALQAAGSALICCSRGARASPASASARRSDWASLRVASATSSPLPAFTASAMMRW